MDVEKAKRIRTGAAFVAVGFGVAALELSQRRNEDISGGKPSALFPTAATATVAIAALVVFVGLWIALALRDQP